MLKKIKKSINNMADDIKEFVPSKLYIKWKLKKFKKNTKNLYNKLIK